MKFRMLSYNTQSGFAVSRKVHDWRAQAREIASHSPDVVALQEVAIRHPMGKPVDYPAEVARFLGMNYLFAKAMDLDKGGEYGVALLSKFPLKKITEIRLPVPEGIEPRVALIAEVAAPTPFYAAVTHLSYQGEFDGDDAGRVAQINTILDYLKQNKLMPALLAGDLNSQPKDSSIEAVRKGFDLFNDLGDGRPTANSSKFGWVMIDYIAGTPKGAFRCAQFHTGSDCTVSDHYAVGAELELF